MHRKSAFAIAIIAVAGAAISASAQVPTIEIAEDGRLTAILEAGPTNGTLLVNRGDIPFGAAPDWQNALRRQVGGIQAVDVNGDRFVDVVVGCYISNSYPPYPEWKNLIYYNTGGQLEATPSWTSDDAVSTTDVQVADINKDGFLDVFSATGATSPSVIYWGSAQGPSTSPGWWSSEPNRAFAVSATVFDLDHDNDLDVVTGNQGFDQYDPYRPMYTFYNDNGTLNPVPGWQSDETSIQNCVRFGDLDGDGWEDLAVSKWANFETAIYGNNKGTLATTPLWTSGTQDTDRGVAWADVDGNDWPDLVLGHKPTTLYANDKGTLSIGWTANGTYFGAQETLFADVDRDGDQDLADIHFSNGHVRIYQNNNGVLDSDPTWVYDSPGAGTTLCFGDINGDRWLDLIVGNSGDISVMVFYATPRYTVGDLNCDNLVDFGDINPFVLALTDPNGYSQAYPHCELMAGDINGDGKADFGDINPFVALLTVP